MELMKEIHQELSDRSKPVRFACEQLEILVRNELGKPSGDLYPHDMESIESIVYERESLGEPQVRSLSGLEYATGLKGLILSGQRIQDLTPISYITGIEEIDLSNNWIVDLSPLQNLMSLKALILTRNSIYSVAPLRELQNLVWLFLAYNHIRDISPLKNLGNLHGLYLGGNEIQNFSSLEHMQVEELDYHSEDATLMEAYHAVIESSVDTELALENVTDEIVFTDDLSGLV